ncbi:MAG TPA: transcriptional regulator [Deltaproteobacteria bacterium]|nr:transcriptional regulator [Deltaproteobacteria bacterium]
MRMIFMIYDVDFDDDVMDTLSSLELTGYTKWDRVLGKGKRSEPKLDDAVWPGFNCAVMIAVEDDNEQAVFSALEDLFKRLGAKGFAVFELPVLRVI